MNHTFKIQPLTEFTCHILMNLGKLNIMNMSSFSQNWKLDSFSLLSQQTFRPVKHRCTNVNKGCITFRRPSVTALLGCTLAQCYDLLLTPIGKEPSLMSSVTPVLLLLWQLQMSAVKKATVSERMLQATLSKAIRTACVDSIWGSEELRNTLIALSII